MLVLKVSNFKNNVYNYFDSIALNNFYMSEDVLDWYLNWNLLNNINVYISKQFNLWELYLFNFKI